MCYICGVIAQGDNFAQGDDFIRYDPESQVSDEIVGEEQFGIPVNVKVESQGLDDLASGVDGLSTKFTNFTQQIDPLFDKFNNLLGSDGVGSSLLSNLKKNAHMICFNLFSISRANTIPEFVGGGVNLFSNFGFDRILVNKLTEWFGSTHLGEEQSFENTQKLLFLALSTFSTLSPLGFIEKLNLSQNIKEMEAMNKLFDLLANVLGECGLDITSKAKNLRKLRETLVNVMEQLPGFEYDMIHNQTKFLKNTHYSQFTKMKAEIDDLRRDVSTHAYTELRNSTFAAELMEVFRRVKDISNRVEAIRREAKSRPKPQAFLLVGDSQIGKTECVLEIIKRIKRTTRNSPLCEDMANWTIWNHNATDAYHQGYIGQEIHVVDDLFQRTDHVDHADMINFISSNPYLTRQADLSSKGRPYFSRLVLGSVNVLPTTSKAIEKMSALRNRFKIIECTGTAPQNASNIDKDFPHLTFNVVEWTPNGTVNPVSITLPEIIDLALDSLENADSFHLSREDEDEFEDTISGDEQIKTYRDTDKLIFTDSLSGFLSELQRHDRDMYLALRKARITFGDKEIRAVDYISQLDIEFTYQFLQKLKTQNSLPSGDHYFGYGHNIYHWKGTDLIDTNSVYIPSDRNNVEDDDDLDKFNNGFFENFKDKLSIFYWSKWQGISEMFKHYKVAGIFLSGVLGWPMIICSVLLANFSTFLPEFGNRWRTAGKANGEERDDFWFMALGFSFDVASISLTTGLIGYIIYKFFKILSFKNASKFCSSCDVWYNESPFSDTLDSACSLNCKDGELYECAANKASTRLDCEACEKSLCLGDCFHSTEIHKDQLKTRYLDLITIISAREESSPEGKRVRAPLMKRLKHQLEESPMGKRMQAPRFKRLEKHRLEEEIKQLKEQLKQTKEPIIPKSKEILEEPMEEIIIGYSPNGSNIGSNEKIPRPIRASAEAEILNAQVESCIDEGCKNVLASLCNVTVPVYRENLIKNVRGSLHGLGVGKYIITPQHLHVSGDGNYKYYAIINQKEVEIKFIKENINMDIALWEIPRNISPFNEKLLKHVMSDDEFSKHMNRRLCGYQYIPGVAPYGLIQNVVIDYKVSRTTFSLVTGGRKVLDRTLVIEATNTSSPLTSKGDCGGFIVVENPMITKKLIGFHVVGAGRNAYSAILTKELIYSLMPREEINVTRDIENAVLESKIGDFDDIEYRYVDTSKGEMIDLLGLIQFADENRTYMPDGDFEYIGDITYPKPQKVTQLKEHPFKPLFKCTVKPAALDYSQVDDEYIGLVPKNKKGIPDLLMMKAAKYGKSPPKMESRYEEVIKELQSTVVEHLVNVLENEDVSPCDWDEAVGGDTEDTFSHKLKGQTSAGIGWDRSMEGAPIKKSSYFTATHPQKINTETPHGKKLMDTLITTEKLMAKGHRTLSIDKNCLKDEPRPLNKAWKPRLFKARPLDKVILKRKYFLKYKVAWTKAGLQLNHAVGINPISAQWASLYYHLLASNDVGFDADFGGFDTNQLAIFQELSNRIKIQTIKTIMEKQGKNLSREEQTIMEGLLQESVDSVSAVYSNVIMDRHGNSSGDPNTTEDNTEVNDLYHFFCFVVIMTENEFGTDWTFEQAKTFIDYQLYRKYVKAVYFGDDLVIVADPSIEFTFDRVQNIMINVLEQDYTSAHKDHEGTEKPISELTFLKRRFLVQSPTFIMAPIEKESIEQRFCYTMVPDSDLETQAILITEALLEACCHGPTYYRELADKLKAGVSREHWKDHSSMQGVFLNYLAMKSEYFQRYNVGSF